MISSGRISSLQILREDELGNYFLSSYWSICTPGIIGMDQKQKDHIVFSYFCLLK